MKLLRTHDFSAGASVAYFLAQRGITEFVILDRESQPGHQSTGHSHASE
ncbi:MAG: FAD-dependent oxidoreductase [Candidatus Binatus sp.]